MSMRKLRCIQVFAYAALFALVWWAAGSFDSARAQVPGTSGYGILESWSGGALNGSIAFKVCAQTTDDTTPAMGAVLGGCNVLETATGNTGAGSGDITTFDGPILPGMILWVVGMGGANVTNIADAGNFNLEAAWAGATDRVLALYVQAVGDFVEVARVGGPRVMDGALTLGGDLDLNSNNLIGGGTFSFTTGSQGATTFTGSPDVDGYDILLDTDGDSKIVGDRDAGVADDEFALELGGTEVMNIDGPDGKGVYTAVLDDATGDEVAFRFNYTTNKLTSGNDTGVYVDMTDTISPGTSTLMSLNVGGSEKFVAWANSDAKCYGNFTTGGNLYLTAGGSLLSTADGSITIAPHGSGDLIVDSGSGELDIRDFACSGDGACSCTVSGQGSHCFENGIEAQGISYLSGVVTQIAGSLYMKSLNDFLIRSHSDDGVHFCTGDDGYGNNNIIITNRNWYNVSHGHNTHSPDPFLWGHSITNPASDYRQYWGLTHNQTASEFRTGTGYHYFSAAVLSAQGNIVFTKQPLAGDKFTVDVDQWEFVASGPAANKIVIGATLNLTVDAAVIRMNLDLAADTAEAVGYPTGTSTTSIHLPADTPGVAGNAIVLTEDVDAGAAFSVTGAGTLTGGRDAVTGTPAAGTNSYFPGIVEMEGAYLIPPRIINAAPTEPVACGAAYEGATVYVDDTNDTNYGQLCICANLDGTGYDWRTVADTAGTACPFF